jgi:hypothetical protein
MSNSMNFENRVLPRAYYPRATVDAVFDRLAAGESLRSITASPDMPARDTVYSWINQDAELKARFVEAQQRGIAARHSLA